MLFVEDLKETIDFMFENQMYKNLVIYMDSPFSGSFLSKVVDKSKRVYAVSSTEHAQYGTFCAPDEIVNGIHAKTCISNLFSTMWMDHVDPTKDETLQK